MMFEKLHTCVLYKEELYLIDYHFAINHISSTDNYEYVYLQGFVVDGATIIKRRTFTLLKERFSASGKLTDAFVLHMRQHFGKTFMFIINWLTECESIEQFERCHDQAFDLYLKQGIYLHKSWYEFTKFYLGTKITAYHNYDEGADEDEYPLEVFL